MKLLAQAYSTVCTFHTFPEFLWRSFGFFLLSFCLPFTAPILLLNTVKMNIRITVQSLSPGPPASTFPTLFPYLPKWLFGNIRQITPLPCSKFSSGFRSRQNETSTPAPSLHSPAPQLLLTIYSRSCLLNCSHTGCFLFSVSGLWNLVFPLPGMLACDWYFHLFRSLLRSSLLCQAAPPQLIFFFIILLSSLFCMVIRVFDPVLFRFALSPLLLCCALLSTVGMNSFFQAPLPSAFQAKPARGR